MNVPQDLFGCRMNGRAGGLVIAKFRYAVYLNFAELVPSLPVFAPGDGSLLFSRVITDDD